MMVRIVGITVIVALVLLAGRAVFNVEATSDLQPLQATRTPTPTPTRTPTFSLTEIPTITPLRTGTVAARIGICHRTSSTTQPLVYMVVDANAVDAHRAHGDLIGVASPSACLLTQTPTATRTLTPNRTATPTPAATRTPASAASRIGICHRTGSSKNRFVHIVVAVSALDAHRKHGDVIGVASAAACPKSASNLDSRDGHGSPNAHGRGDERDDHDRNHKKEKRDK